MIGIELATSVTLGVLCLQCTTICMRYNIKEYVIDCRPGLVCETVINPEVIRSLFIQ